MKNKKKQGDLSKQFLSHFFKEMELTGLYVLLDDNKIQEVVTKIYEESGLYIGDSESAVARKNQIEKQAICPYCQSAIKIGAETVYCGSCHLPYHKDCWTENRGCAVFGCESKESSDINCGPVADVGLIDLTTEDLPDTPAALIRHRSDSHIEEGNSTSTSDNRDIWVFIAAVLITIAIFIILAAL